MVQQAPELEQFKQQQLPVALRQEAQHCRLVRVAKHANIYTCSAQDETVYFIESGQIKLVMLAPNGRECLLTILKAGDIFGELCLAGAEERQETATAMQPTVVRLIPRAQFFLCLNRYRLLEEFVHYLAVRI